MKRGTFPYTQPKFKEEGKDQVQVAQGLARISHRQSAASPQSSALAVLRSVGLLDVLHEYDCGGARVVSVASLARTALATPRYDKR